MKKISGKDAKGRRGSTDWHGVKSMTDDEIKKAAQSDVDAKELRQDELELFRRNRH